jgi:spore coat protein A
MTGNASRAPWRNAIGPASALAVGTVAWEIWLHAARGAETAGAPLASGAPLLSRASLASGVSLPHLLVDAALALPLAFVAIVVARTCAPARTMRSAFVAAGMFALLLVPSVGAHQVVHAWLTGARALPPALAHAIHSGAARGAPLGLLAHGARDAIAAFPVALLISAIALRARPNVRTLRRATVLATAATTVFTLLPAHGAPAITPFAVPLPIPQTLTSPDITLTAAETDVPVLPGSPTKMWTYNGTFPGPTIRRPSGTPTRVTVVNDLPASDGALTLHHHGAHSASADDGQPASNLIANGASRTYTYDFTEDGAPERGATQWYHDHAMDVTGRNVWMGLAGMVILDDPAEAQVNAELPNGARDVPLMIADRTFDQANQIPYTFNPEGDLGTAILVNGAPQPYFEVADAQYRFRILNASNVRSYDFKLSDGREMTQVATESGLLPAPVRTADVVLGPAERAEVVVDFRGELGQTITLDNAIGFTPNLSKAMQFRVVRHEDDASFVPSVLRATPQIDPLSISATRLWLFGRDVQTGQWTINGHGFDPARIDAAPKLGSAERWVFVNTTDVDHIVHIHDVDWRIVSRAGGPDPTNVDSVLGEAGLRESFRLHPNEVVTVVSRFTDHLGVYVLHCHMLEHEDNSMMAQFQVVP